ncbi:TRAFs-binding domain-containing protein [Agrobacterium radiobacter]|uniref:TRAFs-binding domain-containing protein n=1 Tax=Agrobacterium radiobacter TaxID=362 RepID=UPI003F8353F4
MSTTKPDDRPVCFVVMGFGKKTDYESGRTLDLDSTFDAIIQPAAESAGLRPIRAIDINASGVIDVAMYDLLLRAEVVVADISTGNVNAVYELGVRHALRPNTTVIMKEKDGKLHFDLNHINTFMYEHLGPDIGHKEAKRASAELGDLIKKALVSTVPDSPVYTYLPRLQRPRLSDEQYAEVLNEAEEAHQVLSAVLQQGRDAFDASDMIGAAVAFERASELKPEEPSFRQQYALATYKSRKPSAEVALLRALKIMEVLKPDDSNDPETLGITGAIHKNLWLLQGERLHLDLALRYYSRGFEIRRDYYNGENLASCFDMRSAEQEDPAERLFDKMSASKTRIALVGILQSIVSDSSFTERSDQAWVYATLANTMYGLGRTAEGALYEDEFRQLSPPDWHIETFERTKVTLSALVDNNDREQEMA